MILRFYQIDRNDNYVFVIYDFLMIFILCRWDVKLKLYNGKSQISSIVLKNWRNQTPPTLLSSYEIVFERF